MRVLVINDSMHARGGAEIYVRSSVLALTARGNTVIGVSGDASRPPGLSMLRRWYSLPDLFISSLRPGRLLRNARAVEVLRGVISLEKPDVAQLHMFDSPLGLRTVQRTLPTIRFIHTAWPYCPAGTRWLPRSNSECTARAGLRCLAIDARERCLTTVRGERYGLKNSLRRILDTRIQARALRFASVIAANSAYTASQVEQLIGACDHLCVVSPPIPYSEAEPREPIRGRLLFVGRLVPGKGCADAIRVAAALPGTELAIAGDGPERSSLENLAGLLGARDRVSFLGWLSHRQIEGEMQKAQVVLFPSAWPETFGQVGPQAAANGRPVVAYALGGVTAWLSSASGALVPPGNLDAFIGATRELVEDPGRARSLGEEGRKRMEEFSLDAFGGRIQRALENALGLGVRATRP